MSLDLEQYWRLKRDHIKLNPGWIPKAVGNWVASTEVV